MERAKRFARRRGTSVSRLVETYLGLITRADGDTEDAPVLRSIRGLLRKGNVEEYRRHLAEKYR